MSEVYELTFSFVDYVRYSKPKRLLMYVSRVAGSGVKPSFLVYGSMEIEQKPIVHLLQFDQLSGQNFGGIVRMQQICPPWSISLHGQRPLVF